MAKKNTTKPRERDSETGELASPDDARKRRRTTAVDEIEPDPTDQDESGVGRQLIGKRHS
jgi:hypothetical protein